MSAFRNVASDFVSANTANLLDAGGGTPGGATALSDTLRLLRPCIGIMIHAAGAVSLVPKGQLHAETGVAGTEVLFPALAVGVVHPIAIARIGATATVVGAANITLFFSDY